MTLQAFIRTNRPLIDDVINAAISRYDGQGGRGTVPAPPPRRNDAERREWVLNDEGLYRWARLEGVHI